MPILTICCGFQKRVIQVADTARILSCLMCVLNALAHCHIVYTETLCSSSQMTFACVICPLLRRARRPITFYFIKKALDPSIRALGNSLLLKSFNFANASACFNRYASIGAHKRCRVECEN